MADAPLTKRFTIADLRALRETGKHVAMLTCYDYTMARLMHAAGVPTILAGDSAANVVLGYPTTLPVSLDFMIEITAAVRRGAPDALLVADMPFGSYQASEEQGLNNIFRMVKGAGCDAVKVEVSGGHEELIRRTADAGVSVVAHLGLRPQAVGLMGGYRVQGKTAKEAEAIVALALRMEACGAAAILLEAVPPEVAKSVVDKTNVPVIGCGAGSACHASVIVTHDALGLTQTAPKFVPRLGDVAEPLKQAFGQYVRQVASGAYPGPEHVYEMPAEEKRKFLEK